MQYEPRPAAKAFCGAEAASQGTRARTRARLGWSGARRYCDTKKLRTRVAWPAQSICWASATKPRAAIAASRIIAGRYQTLRLSLTNSAVEISVDPGDLALVDQQAAYIYLITLWQDRAA